jgi:hypothetical protein
LGKAGRLIHAPILANTVLNPSAREVEGADILFASYLNPIFLPNRFLSASIAQKSHKRFGLRDFRAIRLKSDSY